MVHTRSKQPGSTRARDRPLESDSAPRATSWKSPYSFPEALPGRLLVISTWSATVPCWTGTRSPNAPKRSSGDASFEPRVVSAMLRDSGSGSVALTLADRPACTRSQRTAAFSSDVEHDLLALPSCRLVSAVLWVRYVPLPLKLRLPNPPLEFVGRRQELSRLAALLERGPLSVVRGLGGLGKTALVLAAVHSQWPDRVVRSVYLQVEAGATLWEVLTCLTEAIGQAEGKVCLDRSAPPSDELFALLIDLVESDSGHDPWVCVIDDAHHLRDIGRLLDTVARYGREGRWLVVGRAMQLPVGLEAAVLDLGPMEDSDLSELVQGRGELSPSQFDRLLVASGGSPQKLLHAMRGQELQLTTDSLIGSPLMVTLGLAEIPLSQTQLERLTGGRVDEELTELEAHGLAMRSASGWMVQPSARRLTHLLDPDPVTRVDLVHQLGKESDAESIAEAIRLALEGELLELAEELLDGFDLEQLSPLAAFKLHRALAGREGQTFERASKWSALASRNREQLQSLRPPEQNADEDALPWLRARFLLGDFLAVVEPAAELSRLAHQRGEAHLAYETAFLALRAGFNSDASRAPLDLVGQLAPVGDDQHAQCASLRARLLAFAGDLAGAETEARAAEARLERVSPGLRVEVTHELASLYHYNFGDVVRARAILSRTRRLWSVAMPGTGQSWWPLRRAWIAIDAGELVEAEADLAPYLDGRRLPEHLRPYATFLDALRRYYAGPIDGLDRQVTGCRSSMKDDANPAIRDASVALSEAIGVLNNAAPESELSDLLRLVEPWRSMALCSRAILDLQQGRDPPWPIIEKLDCVYPPALALRQLASAMRNLLEGSVDARKLLGQARAGLHDAGVRSLDLDVLRTDCEAALLLDDREALRTSSRELEALASQRGSPLFEREARWFEALSLGTLEPSRLENWAADDSINPRMARRLRRMLDSSWGNRSRTDEAIVERAVKWLGARIETQGHALEGRWEPGWGFDERRERCWFYGQEPIDLADHPVLSTFLRLLGRQPSGMGKEELVTRIWNLDAYHPLRHDKRLQATVRNLRQMVEQDPTRPRRIVTFEGGYALGGDEPFRRVVSTSQPVSPRV